MKKGTFRRVNFTIEHGVGYGQYIIRSTYKGKQIVAHSTNSEAYDYLDDDSDIEKCSDARRYCYRLIVSQYNLV